MTSDTTSRDTVKAQISEGLENLCIKEGLVFLLVIFVTFSLLFNALFAFSALDGSRMLAQVAEEHGISVDRLGDRLGLVGGRSPYDAVNDRYEHTLQGWMLYKFEWMGGQ